MSVMEYFGRFARMAGRRRPAHVPGWAGLAVAGLAEGVARITGRPPLFTRDDAKGAMVDAVYRGDKAARELGFVARTGLDAGMERVEAWLRDSGELPQGG